MTCADCIPFITCSTNINISYAKLFLLISYYLFVHQWHCKHIYFGRTAIDHKLHPDYKVSLSICFLDSVAVKEFNGRQTCLLHSIGEMKCLHFGIWFQLSDLQWLAMHWQLMRIHCNAITIITACPPTIEKFLFFSSKKTKTYFMRDLPKPLPCSNATSTWCKTAFKKKEIKTSFMPKPLAYPMLLPANLSYYIRVLSLWSTLKCHWWAVARNLYRLVNKFNHGLGFYTDSHVST